MKLALFSIVVALGSPIALVTDYKKDARFHVEHEVGYTIAVTELDMEIDGERRETESPAQKIETRFRIVQSDEVRDVADGQPTHVRRHYDEVGGRTVSTTGTDEQPHEIESAFDGLSLDLTRDGDDVRVEVVDGEKPSHDGAFDAHRLEICVDGLLPKEQVEKGDHWDLDNDSIRRALALDLRKSFFPEKTEAEPQDEGRERRGRRGMQRLGTRGERELLAGAEWTGTATLVSLAEDVDGTECAKIKLELKSHGSLPEPEPSEGRRSRMPASEATASLENTYSIELEGAFLFAVAARRPVLMELDGKVELESNREMTRSERTVRIHTRMEGEIDVRVHVDEGKAESK